MPGSKQAFSSFYSQGAPCGVRLFCVLSDYIPSHADAVQKAARQAQQVEHPVHPLVPGAKAIEQKSQQISRAAGHQQGCAVRTEEGRQRLHAGYQQRAHENIHDDGSRLEPFHIRAEQPDATQRQQPDRRVKGPQYPKAAQPETAEIRARGIDFRKGAVLPEVSRGAQGLAGPCHRTAKHGGSAPRRKPPRDDERRVA